MISFTNTSLGLEKYTTPHAIITLVDRITSSLDSGDLVIGVFLDLKRAFDTVGHQILIRKLLSYGIRGNTLKWFQSYLTDISQYVTYQVWCFPWANSKASFVYYLYE